MADDADRCLTTQQVLARDWTRTLIARFMPTPDGRARVDHWSNFRDTDTYVLSRVEEIEKSEEFGKAFLRSWKGRMKGRKPEDVLKQLQERTD